MRKIKMTGRFGRLVIQGEAEPHIHPSGQPARQFHVRCDCGEELIVRGSTLRNGTSKSCGCFKSDEITRKAKETDHPDMEGARFGRLLVIRRATEDETPDRGRYRWYWVGCDCGTEKIVAGYVLRRGTVVSCGCYSIERSTKHGHARHGNRSAEYQAWSGIIKRCEDPNCQDFPNYGGRGIRVCKRWRLSYSDFLEDMGLKPSPKHSIDRINNDKGYNPANCHWATPTEQANNRRKRRST